MHPLKGGVDVTAQNEPDWARVIKVFAKATTRMQGGAKEYGEYDPATDERDMYHEAQEELLDAIVYLGMQYLKLDEMRRRSP
jgi:hypothetical protein